MVGYDITSETAGPIRYLQAWDPARSPAGHSTIRSDEPWSETCLQKLNFRGATSHGTRGLSGIRRVRWRRRSSSVAREH